MANPESRSRLDASGARQVFDFGRNRVEALEVHDFIIVAQCLLPVEQTVVVVWGFGLLCVVRAKEGCMWGGEEQEPGVTR